MSAPTPLTDGLFKLLAPSRPTAVVDIGASSNDPHPLPYRTMLAKGLCTLVGCEPHDEERRKLIAKKGPNETYLPYAVGDGRQHTFNVCRSSAMSSLLTPNPRALEHFPNFKEWGTVTHQETVHTVRLDDVKEIHALDFLKMDVQGSELAILENGRTKLATTIAVQTEVSFICLYENQPAIGEIDQNLRSQGFVPHSLVSVSRRMIAPVVGKDIWEALNQVLEADIVYVRDFTRPEAMTDEQLKHLALVAHHAYASFDLAANCVFHLRNRKAIAPDAMEQYQKVCAHLQAS